MKNLVSAIVTIAFLIYPSVCLSAYIIQLKNGAEFITYHYWEEGGEVKFNIYGGVMGIPKDFVKSITESDLAYKEVMDEPNVPETSEIQAEAKEKSEEEKEKITPVPNARDKALQEEKRRLTTEIQTATAAFKEAKAKNGREQMQAERKRMLSLKTELSRLLKKVKDAHGGQVPAWWDS